MILRAAIALIALAATCGAAPAGLGTSGLADMLEAARKEHAVPAIAAAVKTGDAEISAASGVRAAGHSQPASVADLWHVGSITKAMTATMIARLVEKRRLSFATTIEQGLPDLAAAGQPGYRRATLLDLLSSRAGLAENIPIPELDKFYDDPRPLAEQRRHYARLALEQPPLGAPGAGHHYSNAGYVVAGAIAERAAGTVWEELMRREVFVPLALGSAGFGAPGTVGQLDQPRGHVIAADGALRALEPSDRDADNPRAHGPAGTVHMTITDLARFGHAHTAAARATKYLSAATLETLHRSRGEDYALGWYTQVWDPSGEPLILHSGSNGAWYAMLLVAPESNIAIGVAANAGSKLGGEDAVRSVIGQLARIFLPRQRS